MKFDRKTSMSAEIPTSSMADIAFLLIIFFMVTTVFSATKGLELALPKEEKNAPPETQEAVFIKVAPDSSVTVKNISIPTQSEVQEYIALFGQNPFETRCQ